jgi:hypothetical protein
LKKNGKEAEPCRSDREAAESLSEAAYTGALWLTGNLLMLSIRATRMSALENNAIERRY